MQSPCTPTAAQACSRSLLLTPCKRGQSRLRLLAARGAHCAPLGAFERCSESHRSPVVVQQQQQQHVQPQVAAEAAQQQHLQHSHRLQQDDGSLKIIMLLSLSLTLLLLPWVSKHPEFLIAPVLLAFTPVVGNGVRPVLKEAAAGLVKTLQLSLGLLTHNEQHLPHGSQHHNSHHNSHHHQQHQHSRHQPQPHHPSPAHQQPQPLGPSSPWPNPARLPVTRPPGGPTWQQQQQPAPGSSNPAAAAAVLADELDSDWSPRGPPDPHQADPHSQQHLQQLLAADSQVEAALRPAAAQAVPPQQQAAGGGSSAGRASPTRRSLDGGDPATAAAAAAAYEHSSSQHHGHLQQRDPRVLSREAKQQLYHGGSHGQ